MLSSPDVKAFRNGSEVSIKRNEILLGEIIKLKAGAQVCSDSVIREGEVEVNEALLTGESQAIKKGVGDILLSTVGSYGHPAVVNATSFIKCKATSLFR